MYFKLELWLFRVKFWPQKCFTRPVNPNTLPISRMKYLRLNCFYHRMFVRHTFRLTHRFFWFSKYLSPKSTKQEYLLYLLSRIFTLEKSNILKSQKMKIGLVLLGGKLSSVRPLVRIVHTEHLFKKIISVINSTSISREESSSILLSRSERANSWSRFGELKIHSIIMLNSRLNSWPWHLL